MGYTGRLAEGQALRPWTQYATMEVEWKDTLRRLPIKPIDMSTDMSNVEVSEGLLRISL